MSVSNPRQTFLNPVVPFAGTILGGLLPGEMVLIQGSVPSDADRFQVDLTCGSSVRPRADVAFHFNPRFDRSPRIVCNTLQRERWGREEILPGTPFAVGEAFEVVVLVTTDSFKVAVNGAHVLEYKQRVELEGVDTLSISGKVRVQAVGILPSSTCVRPAADVSSRCHDNHPVVSSSGDLNVPFTVELAQGLSVGRSIAVRGELHHKAHSFCINLRRTGSSDIALHLNPRVKKQVLVRNSFLFESWGPEETQLDFFPFAAGQYFEVIILCEAHQFRVAVNGVHLLEFKHRVQDLSCITQVEVVGDVTLSSLTTG